jgi:hypothetical protein
MTALTGSIIDACADGALFAKWFRDPATWQAWFVFLRVLFGLPLSEAERTIFRQCTGLEAPAPAGYREGWLICGRRAGKSLILALIAVFLAAFVDWSPYLSPGERGTIMIVAADRRQARVIFRYLRAFLQTPLLKDLITRETAEILDLSNDVTIEILTASFRTVRGYTLIAALCDEIAFWRSDESANPDTEIISAIRPAMSTVPGAMLLCASSPYARKGALWGAFRRHFGKSGPVLVWKASTRTMNPTVPQSVIDEAIEADSASASAEYGAEFRVDIEGFVSREVVDAAVVTGRHELPPQRGVDYQAFTDPSGGSADSFTLAIAHEVEGCAVMDAVREVKPPFSPDATVEEFAALLRSYGISRVVGDRFGGEWPRERFRAHGVEYDLADKPKSDIYRDLLPVLNGRRVELLDQSHLVSQLCGLERRTARGGKDSIDHGPGAHDDVANAVAGVVRLVLPPEQASSGWGVIQFYKREAQRVADHPLAPPEPPFGFGLKPVDRSDEVLVEVEAPAGVSSFYDSAGRSYTIGVDRIIAVPRSETPPLRAAGWKIVAVEGLQI